jgi:hypothetical protein
MNDLAKCAAELYRSITGGGLPEKVRVSYDCQRGHWTATLGPYHASAPDADSSLRGLITRLGEEVDILVRGFSDRLGALKGVQK